MDKSVDSIGSCSLDVDADSTDFSDTSCSLGFLTPSSTKDLTNDFTAGIKERCKIPLITSQPATTIFNSESGEVTTVLSSVAQEGIDEVLLSTAKKPSYLNLACCVNGYSNLTTYDSKLRQDINRSREVSPIRPLIHSMQFTRIEGGFNNTLTVPQLDNQQQQQQYRSNSSSSSFTKLSNGSNGERERNCVVVSGSSDVTDNVYYSNENIENNNITNNNIHINQKSFIQQRVERLYGVNSATTQSFLTKSKSNDNKLLNNSNSNNSNYSSTLFYHNKQHNNNTTNNNHLNIMDTENVDNSNTLPVLRHLNPEFRSQLTLSSPKKSQFLIRNKSPINNKFFISTATANDATKIASPTTTTTTTNNINTNVTTINKTSNTMNVIKDANNHIDNKSLIKSNGDTSSIIVVNNIENNKTIGNDDDNITSVVQLSNLNKAPEENGKMHENIIQHINGTQPVMDDNISGGCTNLAKDGNYFLTVLHAERERILSLALIVEEEMNALRPDEVSEDVMGYLRSASGKARLLATEKMKQFEGLCFKNINHVSDNGKFMTTDEDLQGFWDMLLLQVNDIDEKHKEIEWMKANNWEKPKSPSPGPPNGAKLVRRMKAKPDPARNGTNGVTATSKTPNTALSAAAQKREAQRKQLMELKKRNKLNQNNNNDVEFFVETS